MAGKALVTGGAGFIGSHVVKRLLAAGWEVYIYDSFTVYMTPDPEADQPNFAFRLRGLSPQARIVRGNTLNKDFLRRTVLEIEPDVIIHMAAMPLAAVAIEHTEEAYDSILTSTHNILEILRDVEHPCRMVFTSSSMVYGDFLTPEVDEDHPKNPKDIYGAFKLAGEVVANAYAKNYGIDTVIVRPSAVYGPTDMNQRVVQKFITNAMKGLPLTLDGDGSMRLDFSYVEDTALGIYLAATHPNASGNVYNVTRGEGRSLKDLAEAIRTHFPNLGIRHQEAPAYMPQRGTLSIGRAAKDMEYEPEVPLEEGIRRYVEHLKNHTY